jgi:predicted nucleic acid-binding Zn ribbon protein
MQHARPTLRKIFADALRREGKNAPMLAWPLACGGKTAEHTNAVSFSDGVLTVAVPDKAWRQQLQSFSGQYLASLNQLSSEPVNSIDFVMMNQPERSA